MAKSLKSKEGVEALRQVRKLEKHTILSDKELLEVYREGMSLSEKLKKLLRPSWFVKDLDETRREK